MRIIKLVLSFQFTYFLNFHYACALSSNIYRSRCRREAIFQKASATGKFLGDHAGSIIRSQISRSWLECALGCVEIAECLSINFHERSNGNECKLMKIDQFSPGAKYVSKSGWVHYQPFPQVRLLTFLLSYLLFYLSLTCVNNYYLGENS